MPRARERLDRPLRPPARRPARSPRRTGPRRTTAGGPAASPSTGRMPFPSLPVLSATNCSTHMPKAWNGRTDEEGQLVAPRERRGPDRRPEPRGPGCPHLPRGSAPPSFEPGAASPQRPHRRERRERGRSSRARSSALRSPGPRGRPAALSAARPPFSRAEPGSVMTTKRSPACLARLPSRRGRRSNRRRYWARAWSRTSRTRQRASVPDRLRRRFPPRPTARSNPAPGEAESPAGARRSPRRRAERGSSLPFRARRHGRSRRSPPGRNATRSGSDGSIRSTDREPAERLRDASAGPPRPPSRTRRPLAQILATARSLESDSSAAR